LFPAEKHLAGRRKGNLCRRRQKHGARKGSAVAAVGGSKNVFSRPRSSSMNGGVCLQRRRTASSLYAQTFPPSGRDKSESHNLVSAWSLHALCRKDHKVAACLWCGGSGRSLRLKCTCIIRTNCGEIASNLWIHRTIRLSSAEQFQPGRRIGAEARVLQQESRLPVSLPARHACKK